MIIGYARVSTSDQNTASQIDALKLAGCERIYQEKESGAKADRAELSRCLDALREGDTLVVYKLDRFGRSLKDLINMVADLEKSGIEFKSITEGIDTRSPTGKFVFNIMAVLAEYERERIIERTKGGLESARARGRFGGRKPKMSDSDVRKAKAMLLDPMMTKKEVADHFNISRVTLDKYLKQQEGEQ